MLVACGGDDDDTTCGASVPAPASAQLVTAGGEAFSYQDFTASENNDCPAQGAPTSVTIAGQQSGTGFAFALCLPRPDRLGGAISLADSTLVQLTDVSAQDGASCTYVKNAAAVPTGTITFEGYCAADGTVFNMTFAGAVDGTKVCGVDQTSVSLELAGSVSVTSQQ